MTEVLCDLCTAPVPDLAHVCTRCARGLALDLAAVPGLVAELDVALSKQARMGSGVGGRSAEVPLPFDATASAVGGDLAAVLASWAALVVERRGVPAPPPSSAACARWLAGHVEWLRHHEAGGDAVTEIRGAVRAVRRVIDRPEGRVYAGPCSTCSAPLYARPGAAEVACRACATDDAELVYDVQERRQWMLGRINDLLMYSTAAGAALRAVGVQVADSTIRYLAQQQRIQPHGHDERGRIVYRLGDIIEELVKSTNAKKGTAKTVRSKQGPGDCGKQSRGVADLKRAG